MANYGIDAPGVIRNLLLLALAGALLAFAAPHLPLDPPSVRRVASIGATFAVVFGLQSIGMLWTSLGGKRIAARQLVDHARLQGAEQVLDVGCGRGLLLVEAARRLKSGTAVGLDLWNVADLSGNNRAATEANIAAEGVADRVTLSDGDMCSMPFTDASFDCVVSSLAVHNVYDPAQRAIALAEIVRVLRPGGRVLVQDFRHAREYQRAFVTAGLLEVTCSLVNPLLMFPPTWRVQGRKPG